MNIRPKDNANMHKGRRKAASYQEISSKLWNSSVMDGIAVPRIVLSKATRKTTRYAAASAGITVFNGGYSSSSGALVTWGMLSALF